MEVWKDIPEYSGLYEASNKGRIRSKKDKTTSSARFKKRVWKQRILKQKIKTGNKGKRKDAMVCLWKNGKPYYHTVSRLIATTFCGDFIDSNLTVNHKDGNTLNNCATNLEWCTRSENIKYGFCNGQYSSIRKTIKISVNGKVKEFKSTTETDKWLKRYRGYTSRQLKCGYNYLINENGETFFVI